MNTHHNEQQHGLTVSTVLAGLVIGLAAMVAIMGLSALPSPPAAEIGDIIAFNRSVDTQDLAQVRAVRLDRAGGTCMLDPAIMGNGGGSLVIESQLPGQKPRFAVDWAGPHTAAGADDCGTSARLSLPDTDLTTLAMAAGGFGVADKSLPLAAPAGVTDASR